MASTLIEGSTTLEEPDSTSADTAKTLRHPAICALPQLQPKGSSGGSTVLDGDPASSVRESSTPTVEPPRKVTPSLYTGVAPQRPNPNGRWGSQIYEKHQRIWLGTYDSETAAARAYDIMAYKARGQDAVTNFALPEDPVELHFLASHSKMEIADMLRKHSYSYALEQCRASVRTHGSNNGRGGGAGERELLFEKVVTPSDVGRLNRLVIPKQCAEKHLPLEKTASVLLTFEDDRGLIWRFRYSYWSSSHSYVLTKGWFKYVKDKELRAGDVLIFKRGVVGDAEQLYIERKRQGCYEQRIRLFGADVFEATTRRKELELFPVHGGSLKRQCVGDS